MRLSSKKAKRLVLAAVVFCVCLFASFGLVACDDGNGSGYSSSSSVQGPPRDSTAVVLEVSQPGTRVVADDNAVLDYSNAADGYVCALSYLEGIRVKVLVEVAGIRYQYTIDQPGVFITIPLSEDNGLYSVSVWRNVSGDSYSPIFNQDIDVVLNDGMLPFLYPNQFVSFAAGDVATNLSQQLATGSITEADAINSIYRWVCNNVSYDMEKANTVASGYLPNNTDTIETGMGICFDYAVLTTSMLRAQSIPAKLIIGYAGSAYHAWIEVYSAETGKVLHYNFTGDSWVRMDPTFDASTSGIGNLSSIIGDGEHYQDMYRY